MCAQNPEGIDQLALSDAMEEFDRRMAAVDETQGAVEMVLSEEDLDKDLDEAEEYRLRVRAPRILATGRYINKNFKLQQVRQI